MKNIFIVLNRFAVSRNACEVLQEQLRTRGFDSIVLRTNEETKLFDLDNLTPGEIQEIRDLVNDSSRLLERSNDGT